MNLTTSTISSWARIVIASQTHLNKILTLYKERALRFIYTDRALRFIYTDRNYHSVSLFIDADVLPINFLYYEVIIILFHAWHG